MKSSFHLHPAIISMYSDDDDFDDLPDDSPAETLPCPECGADIYEESDQCPVCGAYVTFDRNVWSDRSPAWIFLGLAGVITVIVALILFW